LSELYANLEAVAGAHAADRDAVRRRESLRKHYSRVSGELRSRWSRYYYKRIQDRLCDIVEPGSKVLDIGCGTGELLSALRPSVGVGVDLNDGFTSEATRRHESLQFLQMPGEHVDQLGVKFDYVIVSQTLEEIYDLQALFRAIQSVCHSRTRLIIVECSKLWQPLLRVLEWTRLKQVTPEQNWIPSEEIDHLLRLSGFETVRAFSMTPAPFYVPLFSAFMNRVVANLPILHHLGLNSVTVARSVDPKTLEQARPKSASIIIAARNESGHLQRLLDRIPQFVPNQEVIFVEGHSTDDTWAELQRIATEYRGPLTIKIMQQDGKGKGDAVRKGFAAATGDVLMILDADISVPPEELPTFFQTLAEGRGEFINGSRMVYMMDKKAMRFLNLLGNKTFGGIFTFLLSQRFRDTLCGTKVLTRNDYEKIARNRSYFGDFDPFGDFDLLFGASRSNLKIVDVPVHYKARTYGETNISRFRHGLILLRMCLFAARKIKFV
jgi:ubiquinone/menaquinone biosynthesis C-methylase UbiE